MDADDLEQELQWTACLYARQTIRQRVGLDPSLIHLLGYDEEWEQRLEDEDGSW